MKQVRQEFTDKQITFLFLAKQYGLEKVSKGWKAIGKDDHDAQTTGQVIGVLWNCDLVEPSKDGTRMTITALGIKLLDDLCREVGIYFPDGATEWKYAEGLWRIDYNYRYKKYSFHKWVDEEEKVGESV